MTATENLLDPALWRGFVVDALYTVDEFGEVKPDTARSADAVYNPTDNIPLFALCRISDSTKRLENGLEARKVDEGAWGILYEVTGSGSIIGVIFEIESEAFVSAHCTPDGVHLVRPEPGTEFIVKPLYSYKTFRSFRVGPMDDDDAPHDLMLTAKRRWFRRRNDPKFLGFSKDDKV